MLSNTETHLNNKTFYKNLTTELLLSENKGLNRCKVGGLRCMPHMEILLEIIFVIEHGHKIHYLLSITFGTQFCFKFLFEKIKGRPRSFAVELWSAEH